MPCGLVITYKSLVKNLEQHIQYLNSVDTTITGSRNGQAPLQLWLRLRDKGRLVFIKEAQECIKNAEYLHKLFKKEGITSFVAKNSNVVIFEKPNNENFIKEWQLLIKDGIAISNIMPNITKEKIDEFFTDVQKIKNEFEKSCILNEVDECDCPNCLSKNLKSKI